MRLSSFGPGHCPIARPHGCGQKLISRSREGFATPRKVVEVKVHRWLNTARVRGETLRAGVTA